MPRAFKHLLKDIIEASDKIAKYIRAKSKREFLADALTIDAVVRNIQNIGEAIGNFDYVEKLKHPNIDWDGITGMRNILVHEYFGVDNEVVWETTKKDIPVLRKKIIAIQKGLPK